MPAQAWLYNTTNMTNANNSAQLLVAMNSTMGGWLGNVLILGIVLIIIIAVAAKGWGLFRGILTGSFVGFMMSIILTEIGMINTKIYVWLALLTIISFLFLTVQEKGG